MEGKERKTKLKGLKFSSSSNEQNKKKKNKS